MQRRYVLTIFVLVALIGGVWAWDYVRTSLPDIPVPDDPRAQTGLPVAAVILPGGHKLAVEIVSSPKQQQKGLMFRSVVPPDTGMLFVYDKTDYQQIWMKNVPFSLDVVFMDENRKITQIERNIPGSTPDTPDDKIQRANGRGKYIIELAGGEAERLKLKKGMTLNFD